MISAPGRRQLKMPYSDGTTHVIFESVDFIAKLALLVPCDHPAFVGATVLHATPR